VGTGSEDDAPPRVDGDAGPRADAPPKADADAPPKADGDAGPKAVADAPATPRRRRHGCLVALAVFVLALGLAVVLVARNVSRRFIFPVEYAQLHGERPAGSDVVEYTTTDGIRLRGRWVRATPPSDRPTVVYFHGNAESALGPHPLADQLASSRGLDVFVAEYRGYGGAPGAPTEAGLYEDGRAAVLAVGRPPQDVILAGWSLGTGVALELAAEGKGRAVVLLAPFTSIDDTCRALLHDPDARREIAEQLGTAAFFVGPFTRAMDGPLGTLLVADHFDALSKLGRVTIPVIVVHGSDDHVVPHEQGARVADAAKHGTLLTADGMDHVLDGSPLTLKAFDLALASTPRAEGAPRAP
jgi:fermentation-respiration switch protein FrsA (DUF1100 family)